MSTQRELVAKYNKTYTEYQSVLSALNHEKSTFKSTEQEFKRLKKIYTDRRREINKQVSSLKASVSNHKNALKELKLLVKQHPEDKVTYPNMLFDLEDTLFSEERTLKRLLETNTTLTNEWKALNKRYTSPNGLLESQRKGVLELSENSASLHRKLCSLKVRIKTLHT